MHNQTHYPSVSRSSSPFTALDSQWSSLLAIALFSLCSNVLMLIPSIYMLQVYDRVITSRNAYTLLMLTVIAVLLLLTMGALDWVRSQILIRGAARFDMSMNAKVHKALADTEPSPSGETPLQAINDLSYVRQFLASPAPLAFFDVPWLPVYVVLLFLFHPLFGAITLAGMVILFALAMANELFTRSLLHAAGQEDTAATQRALRDFRHRELIDAMGMNEAVRTRWLDRHSEAIRLLSQAGERSNIVSTASQTLRIILQLAIVGIGALLVIDQLVTPGVMIAASVMISRALAPIDRLVGSWKTVIHARDAYRRLDRLLHNKPAPRPRMALPAPKGELQLDHVSVIPPLADRAVLQGVSVRLAAGDFLGVVGPNASGKSSLGRAIVGVWKPQHGTVRLDGVDIAQVDRDALGPYLGYLPQDVALLDGTLSENIARFGPVDAKKVLAAAQLAGVHEMILRLPHGYDTQIGVSGIELSGGQRQRIGLARALYGNPALVVLDEPNSNADELGEQALRRVLMTLKQRAESTVILITHRPSMVAVVDHILVLNNGQPQMLGPREQVLAKLTPQKTAEVNRTMSPKKPTPMDICHREDHRPTLTPVSNEQVFEPVRPSVPTDDGHARIAGLMIVLMAVGCFGLWSATAKLDSAIAAPAVITVESYRKPVQHLKGGIIKDLLVKDGDRVDAGDVLIRLDETQARAEYEIVRGQYLATAARYARLTAERDNHDVIVPDELTHLRNAPAFRAALSEQRRVFAARRASLDSGIAVLKQRVKQFQAHIDGVRQQQRHAQRRIVSINDELNRLKQLQRAKYMPLGPVFNLERTLADVEERRAGYQTQIAQGTLQIDEARLQIQQLQNDFMNEVVTQRRESQTAFIELGERLPALHADVARSTLRAPTAGVVVGLQVHAIGAVIRPGERLLDIVPTGEPLVVEAQVNPSDIDAVHAGLSAQVRLTALNSRFTPTVIGTVVMVSADRLYSADEQPYYLARIEVDVDHADSVQPPELLPGMPAEVLIKTGQRTLLSYLLRPLLDAAARSFSD